MEGMLELSDQKCKTTVINKLRAIMEKTDNMQEQMSDTSREMEILTRNQKEMLEIKKRQEKKKL